MKVLLISPLQKDAEIQNWGAPALGVIKIADYIRHYLPEIELMFFDSQIDKFDPIEKWKSNYIDIVGVSLLHYTLVDSLGFINQWKKCHPESLIVVGGNEAGANYQDVFEKSPTDIAVLAEGENTLLDIIRWKKGEKKLEDVPGIIYRKYAKPITKEDFWDYWRFVDFSQHRYSDYWDQIASLYEEPDLEKIKYVRLLTASHCSKKCVFCSLSIVRNLACGKPVKPVMLEGWQIMALVHRVHRQLPDVRTIYFCTDDVFYPDEKHFLDFVELYKKSGYDYRILIQTASNSLKEEYFPKLKEIGVVHITLGIENCSARIRDSMSKHQDTDKIEQIIEWGIKYSIQIYYLIILFPPKSTMNDLWENYNTITRWISQGVQVSVETVMYAYKGTPVWEDIRYQFTYEKKKIEGIGSYLKDAIYVLPNDPEVRAFVQKFLAMKDDYVQKKFESKNYQHKFKGATAPILVEMLGKMLKGEL